MLNSVYLLSSVATTGLSFNMSLHWDHFVGAKQLSVNMLWSGKVTAVPWEVQVGSSRTLRSSARACNFLYFNIRHKMTQDWHLLTSAVGPLRAWIHKGFVWKSPVEVLKSSYIFKALNSFSNIFIPRCRTYGPSFFFLLCVLYTTTCLSHCSRFTTALPTHVCWRAMLIPSCWTLLNPDRISSSP